MENRHEWTDATGRRVHLETGTEARQGLSGRPLLYMLIGGLLLALLFVVSMNVWTANEEQPSGETLSIEEPAAIPPDAASA